MTIPPEFSRQYEAERARILSKRASWYCVVALAILSLSFGTGLIDLLYPQEGAPTLALELSADGSQMALHILALAYFLVARPSRRRLVVVFTWLIVLVGAVTIVSTPLIDNSSVLPGAQPTGDDRSVLWQGIATLLAVFLLHFLASLLVALSPREGLRALVPLLLFFAASVLLLTEGSWRTKLVLIALSPLSGLPGFAWSWWRHRSFFERFTARTMAKRYAEVERELADARRVHEALFPPPITRGPIGVRYAYRPAHQIGGDFLFVRPLAFPPTSPVMPITVILVDVTGHGVPAALAVNRIHDELNRIFADHADADPSHVLSRLNTFASNSLSPLGMYATAICCRVHVGREHGVVEWANAGHPAGLLRSGGTIRELGPTCPMLGVLGPEAFKPVTRSHPVVPHDAILAYTDGALDATNEEGSAFGPDRLREAFTASDSPEELMRVIEEHSGQSAPDDILLVQIDVAASPS